MIVFLAIYATGNLNAATITFDGDYPNQHITPDHDFQTMYDTSFLDVQFDPNPATTWIYWPSSGFGDLEGVLYATRSHYIDFIATQGSVVYLQNFSLGDNPNINIGHGERVTFKIYDLSDLSTPLAGMDNFDVPDGDTHYVYNYTGPGSTNGFRLFFEKGVHVNGLDNINVTATGSSAIPEPATLFLFGSGLLGLAGACRKRK